MNSLNKNLKTHSVWYLEKKKRYDIKILSIGKVLDKDWFDEKTM